MSYKEYNDEILAKEEELRKIYEYWGEELPPRAGVSPEEINKEKIKKERNIIISKYYGDRTYAACGVYCITNIKKDKIYIGSSINLGVRIELHLFELANNIHCNYLLQNDWNNGECDDFIFEVIWEGGDNIDKNELLFMEQLLINQHSPEYNLRDKVDYVDYDE